MIRLVTIDCWDTILRNSDVWDALFVHLALKAFRVEYPNVTQQTVTAAFETEQDDFTRTLNSEKSTHKLMTRLRRLAAYANLQLSEPALRGLRVEFEKAIFRPLPEVFPGAIEFLSKVKGRQLIICLVCNTGWFSSRAIDTALERRGVARFLDLYAYSDRVGSAKPASKIFEFALSAAACKAAQAIHIGDKLSTDIAGAVNAGLGAIHFHPGGTCANGKIPCASDYDELWDILSSHLSAP